jgi:putative peptidoglycan lipid II flippase
LYLAPDVSVWLNWSWQTRAFQMTLLCGAGGAVYLLVHLLAGTRMRHLRNPV